MLPYKPVSITILAKMDFVTLGQWSASETNRDTMTLDYSHVHNAKQIAKSVNIEKFILREPDAALGSIPIII